MTPKTKNGYWPLPKRLDFLKALSKPEGNQELEFPKGHLRNFEIYLVSLDLPVYRLDNGRTLMDQQEYIAKKGKPAEFFSKDPDSLEALQAQDEILRGLVDEAGLLKYFRKHKQMEALILSDEGRVINGNRRLCAMRKLYEEDAITHSHFAHVRVIVLPTSDRNDIDELEARLQLHEDIKADYAWISEALIYKTRQEIHGLPLAAVANFYEVSEKAAREKLQMLADADRYLESRGRLRRYRGLVKKEYAFKQLNKCRAKIVAAEDQDIFTELVFNLIDRPAVNARIYAQIPLIQASLATFKPKLASGLQVDPQGSAPPLAVPPTAESELTDADILGGGAGAKGDNGAALVAAIAKAENRDRVSLLVQDLVEQAQEEKKEQDVANACLDNVSEAHTSIETALACLTPESKIAGIELHLKNMEEIIRKLREKIADYGKH